MKKIIILAVIIFCLCLCQKSLAKKFSFSPTENQEKVYFTISVGKYLRTINYKKVFVKLNIYLQNSIWHYHESKDVSENYETIKKIIRILKKQGWTLINPLDQADITIEPLLIERGKYYFKIFVYPCDPDPFYNKTQCNKNFDQCFKGVIKKIDYCLQSRGLIP